MIPDKIYQEILELCQGDEDLAKEAIKFYKSDKFLASTLQQAVEFAKSSKSRKPPSRLNEKGP